MNSKEETKRKSLQLINKNTIILPKDEINSRLFDNIHKISLKFMFPFL